MPPEEQEPQEAAATPEDSGSDDALLETLESAGIDPEDFNAYRENKENWEKQQNRRLMELAEERKELNETLRNVAEATKAASTKPTDSKPQSQYAVDPAVFARELQLQLADSEDWNEPITRAQAWKLADMLGRWGMANFQHFVGELPQGEDGKPAKVTLADLHSKASAFEQRFDSLTEKLDSVFTPVEVAGIQEKYEFADEDDIKRAMEQYAGDDDYEAKVMEAAEKSHKKIESKLSKAEKTKRRARVKASKVMRAAAAKGSAVGGKKPASPWGDLRKWNEENPPDWDQPEV